MTQVMMFVWSLLKKFELAIGDESVIEYYNKQTAPRCPYCNSTDIEWGKNII